MLRIKALIGNTTLPTPTYYLSTEPLDYDGKFWEPRITNGFEITNHFSYSDKTGNRIRSITLKIDNRDGYFNAVQESDGFVNSTFTLYYDDASDKSMTFTGKVNVVSEFGDDIVLTLMEMGYEYLKTPFPDAQIAENYYTPEGLTNATWSTIPICIGTVNDLPVKWCDVFNNRFMVCSGPVFKVRKIKFDDTVMYDSTWSDPYKGYQPTPESKKIKVRIYKGIGSDNSPETVDGIESVYKGFCYIEFYDADTGDPIEPRMSDNSVPQVYVDLDGLQNSANTDAERNPAQLIYNFFSKPTSGYEGYGLGVETSDLDFSSAITECDTQEFKIDGVINQKDIFGNWLDILLKSCRGAIVEESNKIKLKIDVAKTVSNIIFDESGETGYDCIVYPWSEPKLEAQINRLRLFYRLNPKTNRYDRIPEINQESPLGDTHLVDDAHALRVNKYNTNNIKFTLIRDDITAHKLAQYYFKRTILQLKTVNIVSSVDVPDNLTAGNVIKLTSAKYGWVEKEFTITQISKGEDNFKLQLQEYDSDVYVYNSITPGSDNTPVDASSYSIPDKPTNMTLTIGTEKLKDGTAQTVITSTFTKPINNVLQTALYYKLKTDTEFKFLDSSLDNEIKHIWKGFQAGDYNFRLVSISPTGVYSSLDIESGDSHFYSTDSYSTETYLTITGDTTAPGIPIINNINPVIGGASISLGITGGTPSDFSHFKIWRCINGGSFTQIEDNWSTMLFTDIDRTTIGYNTVKYRFQAVDNSGNVSSCIDSGSITPLHVDTTDVANNAITTDKITTNQIIAKDFRTACNAGNGTVSGVLFNANGIQAWNASTQTLNVDASTGNVTMSGTVTATAGSIGGFTIDQTEGLFAGTGSTRVQMKAGAGFWAGATAQSSAPFSVNQAGVLTAKSGQIGGWSINSECIWKDNGNNLTILDVTGNTIATYDYANNVMASMGNIMGATGYTGRYGFGINYGGSNLFEVSNTCKQIAGWNFDSECLYSNNIIIDSNGSIGTADFVSGNKGWNVDCDGNSEFNNITARGAIKTAVFIKDEISVVGGKTLIRPATTLVQDATLSSCSTTFYIEDNTQFALTDIIRIKDGATDYWGTISDINTGYMTVDYNSGTSSGTVTKGQSIVNYGSALVTSGGILLDGQCPYIDIYTHNGSPWNGTDSRARLGNLKGWGNFSYDTYGIAIGNKTGHYLTYDNVSNTLNMTGAINIQSGSTGLQNMNGAETIPTLNNFSTSHNLSGYSGYGYISHSLTTATKNGVNVCVNRLIANCNAIVYSNTFKIDPNSAYKINFSTCGDSTTGTNYFGLHVYDKDGNTLAVYPISISTGTCGSATSNFYFWYGNTTTWRDMEAYLLPENIDAKDVPYGKNVSKHAKMPSNAYCMRIRYLNYYNGGTTSTKIYYSPTISKVNIENSNSVHRGLNSTGNLITSVIPACNVAPSGSGLYLGANYLGYHDGSAWKSYMDNNGHFYLNGTSGGLSWCNSLLTVCGTVCSCCGKIGGWTIENGKLSSGGSPNPNASFIKAIEINAGTTDSGAARYNFQTYYEYETCHYFAVGMGTRLHHPNIAWCDMNGILVADSQCGTLFKVGHYLSSGEFVAQIAGWNFNSTKLYNNKVFIDSAGGLCGNYTAGSTGWKIDCDGSAEFNDVTVRGTVCSSAGNIGRFEISDTSLYYNQSSYGSGVNSWVNLCSDNLDSSIYTGHNDIYGGNTTVSQTTQTTNGSYIARDYCSILTSDNYCNCITMNGLNITFCIHCYCDSNSTTYNAYNCLYLTTDTSLNTSGNFKSNGMIYATTCVYSPVLCATNCIRSNIVCALGYINSHCYQDYGGYGCCISMNAYRMNYYQGGFGYSAIEVCVPNSNYVALYTNGRIYGYLYNFSDRNLKCDIDYNYSILNRIRKAPIGAWKWKNAGGAECHVGMIAQDFHNYFSEFSDSCTTVPMMDGIALKGVKEVDENVQLLEQCISKLENCNNDLSSVIKIQGIQIQKIQEQLGV